MRRSLGSVVTSTYSFRGNSTYVPTIKLLGPIILAGYRPSADKTFKLYLIFIAVIQLILFDSFLVPGISSSHFSPFHSLKLSEFATDIRNCSSLFWISAVASDFSPSLSQGDHAADLSSSSF